MMWKCDSCGKEKNQTFIPLGWSYLHGFSHKERFDRLVEVEHKVIRCQDCLEERTLKQYESENRQLREALERYVGKFGDCGEVYRQAKQALKGD